MIPKSVFEEVKIILCIFIYREMKKSNLNGRIYQKLEYLNNLLKICECEKNLYLRKKVT